MPKKTKPDVLLSTVDGDLGIVPGAQAKSEAAKSAQEEGKTITMRDPTTDQILGTAEPKDDEIWNDMFLKKKSDKPVETLPPKQDVKPTKSPPAQKGKTESESTMRVSTSKVGTKLPVPPASKGRIAKQVTKPVQAPVKRVAKPASAPKAKATTPTARTAVKGSTTARKAVQGYKVPEKGSKVEQVVQMALRKIGVSRAELIEATGWTVAPWKWNFENPQGYGYAQRFGYNLETRNGKDGETRYFLTKKK